MSELTVEQVLAAQLAALGITDPGIGQTNEDRVYDAFVRLSRERRQIVSQHDVAADLGLCQSNVSLICRKLVARGRMIPSTNPRTGRLTYVPVVV